MYKILIFLFHLNFALASEFVVWNVGQGQWVSEIHKNFCLHFDMGGEKSPEPSVHQACALKRNFIHLSHWDLDHISYVKSFARHHPLSCLLPISAEAPSRWKARLLSNLKICSPSEIESLKGQMQWIYHPAHARNSNDSSEVMYSKLFQVLIPGDSPKTQEKIWADLAPGRTQGLILGHHGSRTSTSVQLLENLSHLKWAVATARKARYGHPHKEVVELLKKEKVPLLKTEDWGHLHFIKNDSD